MKQEEVESEIAPEAEAEPEVDWSPCEKDSALQILNNIDKALLRIPLERYRCTGRTPYIAYRTGPRRTVISIKLYKKTAVIRLPSLVDGKPKFESLYRVSGSLTSMHNHLSVKISTIVKHIKKYIKARGWA